MKCISVVNAGAKGFKVGSRTFTRPRYIVARYSAKSRKADGILTYRREELLTEPVWSHDKAVRLALALAESEGVPFFPEVRHGTPVKP